MNSRALLNGIRGTRAADHLDMTRGLAAVAVLVFHVRYRFFLDYAEVTGPNPFVRSWYALTAFGHDAVMVFFVVSGFLVGTTVLRDCQQGRWRWSDYATARMVRLYVVLVPGLLLTLGWDYLGLRLFADNAVYTGVATTYHHDFFNVPSRLGLGAIAGNAFFVQGIWAPTLGSNDALWSLAFEFWYYVTFPLLAVAAVSSQSRSVRVACVIGAVAALYLTGPMIVLYFPIWLCGVVVGSMPSSALISRYPRRVSAVAGLTFIAWLVAAHTGNVRLALDDSLWRIDTITGLAFAAWLYTFLHDRRGPSLGAYGRISRFLASISYTLYVAHLPLLVFLRAWLVPGSPWAPTPSRVLAGCVIAAVALSYAAVLASVTELRTAQIRRAIDGWRHQLGSRADVAPRAAAPDVSG